MINEVKQWCEENNYALIDIKRCDLEPDVVFKIAQEATYAYKIDEKLRNQELAFARFLAASYLDDKMPTMVLAKKLNITHGIISHARKMNLLAGGAKYCKPWQQNAIRYFKDKIDEAESKLLCKY